MTQKEFLIDTIEYYSVDPDSRRNSDSFKCKYYPLKETSEGCAIGRHLSPELAQELDTISLPGISNNKIFTRLPKELQKLSQDFLSIIQDLHDEDYYWNSEGLSDTGKQYVNKIINAFNLDIPLYEQDNI